MSNWKETPENVEAVKDEQANKLQRPPMYNVVLLNDDYTPMDFVIEVLLKFFNMSTDQATDIMLTIHYKGKARCGTFTAEVAETKVDQIIRFAHDHQHPLKCTMEKA